MNETYNNTMVYHSKSFIVDCEIECDDGWYEMISKSFIVDCEIECDDRWYGMIRCTIWRRFYAADPEAVWILKVEHLSPNQRLRYERGRPIFQIVSHGRPVSSKREPSHWVERDPSISMSPRYVHHHQNHHRRQRIKQSRSSIIHPQLSINHTAHYLVFTHSRYYSNFQTKNQQASPPPASRFFCQK